MRTLAEGEYFGEIAALTNLRRSATVKAFEFCNLAYLDKSDFLKMKQDFPQIYFSFRNKIKEKYNDENFLFRKKMLK